MKSKTRWIPLLVGLLCGAILADAGWSAETSTGALTRAQSDGYLQWLHSLEQTIRARQEADRPEGNLLYPFDRPGWDDEANVPYRHLAISKAIALMEQEYPGEARRKIDSTFTALSTARNYMNLSEYDSALVWYEFAASLDEDQRFRLDIGREMWATAVAAGDSSALVRLTTNTLGAGELSGRAPELVLAYRWLLAMRDGPSLDLLIRKLESQPDLLTDRLLFWHAYAQSWRREYEPALGHLLKLVRSGGLSRDLSESQRTWVLSAIPDLLFLQDRREAARDLYEVVAKSTIPELMTWGKLQVANLDFLSARYLRASEAFDQLCRGNHPAVIQTHACSMADLTRELYRIQSEGEPYGAAAYYAP